MTKKKWIAVVIVVLIVAIGTPKVVDYVKFKKSQDFVYSTMQGLSVNSLNLDWSVYFLREHITGDDIVHIEFDEILAEEFIQTLQAAPKESYVTADSVGLERSNDKPYGMVLLYFKDDSTYHFHCQDGYVQILAWEQGIGHSFVINDENLSALVEEYNTCTNETMEMIDSVTR